MKNTKTTAATVTATVVATPAQLALAASNELAHLSGEAPVVVVHDGVFHADDVLSVALLWVADVYPKVVRTRKEVTEAHVKIDVGGGLLDHHGESEYYSNGVKFAAVGKLFAVLQSQWDLSLFNTAEEVELFKELVLYPVEAADNGQDPEELGLKTNLFSWVRYMNPTFDRAGNPEVEDMAFNKAVETAYIILREVVADIKATTKAKKLLGGRTANGTAVYLPAGFVPGWNRLEDENLLSCIFKRGDEWCLQMMPSAPEAFDFRKKGVNKAYWDNAISELGVAGSVVFVHSIAFFLVLKDEETAIKLAEYLTTH